MMKLYFRTAFRSFKNNLLYALISIGGLSIGLTVFIISLLYLNDELNYDKGFNDYRNIYRIQITNRDGRTSLTVPQPLSDVYRQNFPEIKTLVKLDKFSLIQPLLKAEDRSIYIDNLYFVDSAFF